MLYHTFRLRAPALRHGGASRATARRRSWTLARPVARPAAPASAREHGHGCHARPPPPRGGTRRHAAARGGTAVGRPGTWWYATPTACVGWAGGGQATHAGSRRPRGALRGCPPPPLHSSSGHSARRVWPVVPPP